MSQKVSSNPFLFSQTEKIGIYTVLEKEKRSYFAVNLFDELESNIRVDPSFMKKPTDHFAAEKGTGRNPAQNPVQTSVQTWFLVLLGAVLLLVLEYYIWLN